MPKPLPRTLHKSLPRSKGKVSKAQIVQQVRQKLAELQELMQHEVPPKKYTKLSTKATVPVWKQNLEGVPGGGIWKMAEALETGTRLAGPTVLRRLRRSPQNCNTTAGNYIV